MDMKTSPLATLNDPTLLKTDALVNNEWLKGATRFDVTDPATGAKLADVANLGGAETEAALAAANQAWLAWRTKPAKERGAILMKWFHLLQQHADDLARIMTAEQGKPLAEAKGEVGYGASFIEWFAEEGKRVYGETIPTTGRTSAYLVLKQSMGVCAAITPWNFPNAMITRKCRRRSPRAARWCIKPAEQTPLSALALAELALRAGMPPGVLNVITGRCRSIEVGKCCARATHRAPGHSFTGSTEVGRILMAQCAPTIKKLSLELGGNAPFIVFDDADLDSRGRGRDGVSKYRNAGQTCVCANRLLRAGEACMTPSSQKLAAKVKTMKVGNGFEAGVTQGPLIDEQALAKVDRHVADAVAKGAKVLTGGKRSELEPSTNRRCSPMSTGDMLVTPARRPSARSRRCSSFKTEAEVIERWPTRPSSALPATSTAAMSGASSASPRRWSTAWSASTPA